MLDTFIKIFLCFCCFIIYKKCKKKTLFLSHGIDYLYTMYSTITPGETSPVKRKVALCVHSTQIKMLKVERLIDHNAHKDDIAFFKLIHHIT